MIWSFISVANVWFSSFASSQIMPVSPYSMRLLVGLDWKLTVMCSPPTGSPGKASRSQHMTSRLSVLSLAAVLGHCCCSVPWRGGAAAQVPINGWGIFIGPSPELFSLQTFPRT